MSGGFGITNPLGKASFADGLPAPGDAQLLRQCPLTNMPPSGVLW